MLEKSASGRSTPLIPMSSPTPSALSSGPNMLDRDDGNNGSETETNFIVKNHNEISGGGNEDDEIELLDFATHHHQGKPPRRNNNNNSSAVTTDRTELDRRSLGRRHWLIRPVPFTLLSLSSVIVPLWLFRYLPAALQFTTILPPSLRTLLLLQCGAALWACSLSVLRNRELVPESLRDQRPAKWCASLLPFSANLSVAVLVHAIVLQAESGRNGAPLDTYWTRCVELFALFTVFYMLANLRTTRPLLGLVIKKVASPFHFGATTFPALLVADCLTSFARPIGEVFGFPFILLDSLDGSLKVAGRYKRYARLFSAIGTSVPMSIRIKQCLVDYVRGGGMNRLPLANALKYAMGFPVVWLAYAGADSTVWLCAAALQSLYALYWDLVHDWDLQPLLSLKNSNSNHNNYTGPDHARKFPRAFYGFMVAVDAALRFTWLVRVPGGVSAGIGLFLQRNENAHVGSRIADEWWVRSEGVAFAVLLLEVVRRMLWVILRTERECLRNSSQPRHS